MKLNFTNNHGRNMKYIGEAAAILRNGRHIDFLCGLRAFFYSTMFGQYIYQV